MKYPAVITKEGAFTLAEFPDCEGCQTYARKGEDIEEVAREALEGWLEANLGRDTIPNRPGTVAIPKNADVREISVPLALAIRLELRRARVDLGLTQSQFGKILGMTQQQYARLESAGSNPTVDTVDRLTKVAGIGINVTKIDKNSRMYAAYDRKIGSARVHGVHKKTGGGVVKEALVGAKTKRGHHNPSKR
jgi:predicted RNase H-like HicB family nuclease/DNA-binding XRE family transcriptional regulator